MSHLDAQYREQLDDPTRFMWVRQAQWAAKDRALVALERENAELKRENERLTLQFRAACAIQMPANAFVHFIYKRSPEYRAMKEENERLQAILEPLLAVCEAASGIDREYTDCARCRIVAEALADLAKCVEEKA